MKIVIHILALLILSEVISSAQTNNQNILSGKVYDSVTLAPLQNASVYLSGTTIGTAANIKGYFEIQNIPSGRYQLVISMIGYNTIVQGINFSDNLKINKDFSLEPKQIEMNTIQISEEETSEWKDNLEVFKKYFLGQTDLTDECKIENQNEIILTKDSNDVLHAKCMAPIVVINHALGYKIECVLTQFYCDMKKTDIKILYLPKFTELPPENESQLKQWNENRKDEYMRSFKRFLLKILRYKDTDNDYFVNYLSTYNYYRNKSNLLRSFDAPFWQSHIDYQEYTKSYVLHLPAFQYVVLNQYTRDQSSIYLPFGSVEIDESGIPIDPLAIIINGDFAKRGIANLLPKFYEDK